MLNPEFVKKMQAKLAPIVQGGENAEKERALNLLAERYADRIASPEFWSEERWILRDSWFLTGEGLPFFEIRAEIQRNYLIALDPSAESKIDNMGSLLSTDLWVDAAAGNLAPEARDRIAKEIKAHYGDALEEEVKSGIGSVPTHLKALKRLGDPRAAARIFRKTYLTAQEDDRLSMMLKPSKGLRKRGGDPYNWIFLLALLMCPWLVNEPILWVLFFASLAVVEIVNSRIVPPLVESNKGQRAYAWIMVSRAFLLTMMCEIWVVSDFTHDLGTFIPLSIGIFALAFFVHSTYSYSFLARKRLQFLD